jgi:tRNA(Arg) A34 adenosine deaminase TadA
MCLAAILWARIGTCYYGNSYQETCKVGFDDQAIIDTIKNKPSKIKIKLIQIDQKECLKLYQEFNKKSNKKIY